MQHFITRKPTMTKAIIYARFSPRPDEDTSLSNDVQIERARAYCLEKGYTVDEPPEEDRALSGKDEEHDPDPFRALSKRKGIQRALARLKPGYVLVCRWRNRLAREPYIQEGIERLAAQKGATVEASDENNSTGLGADLERQLTATMAKHKCIEVRITTSFNMKTYQKAGIRMTRKDRCPFGFAPDPNNSKRLVPVPEEQETLGFIKTAKQLGLGTRATCRYLDERGRSRRGKTWKGAHGIIRAILERMERD